MYEWVVTLEGVTYEIGNDGLKAALHKVDIVKADDFMSKDGLVIFYNGPFAGADVVKAYSIHAIQSIEKRKK